MNSKQETEKARCYIAGPFFSPTQIELVERVEKALEANPFTEAFFSPMRNQLESLPFGSEPWRQGVFMQDVNHVDWANFLVVIADFDGQDTDSGTSFEAGYAYAKGIPIIVVNENTETVNLMLTESLHAYLTSVDDLADYNFIKQPKSQYKGAVI